MKRAADRFVRDASHDDGVSHGDFLEMLEVFRQAPGHVARESDRAVLSVRNDDCKLSHSDLEVVVCLYEHSVFSRRNLTNFGLKNRARVETARRWRRNERKTITEFFPPEAL